MAADANDLSIRYEEDGRLIVKELDKQILSKGAWTTIIFKYQELHRSTGQYGPEKYTIRRYQKRNDAYLPKSKFNISSPKQAQQLVDVLQKWLDEQA